jgi:WD40 repeat protein
LVGVDAFNLCVWNAENGERVHRWRLDNKVFTMAASLTEPLIVTRELHTLTIYDIDQFQRICQLPSGRGLPCLAMSPVDRLLASGEKTRIRLINLECQGVRDIDVSESSVLSLAFSADGRRIVAGCADGQVRSWDV